MTVDLVTAGRRTVCSAVIGACKTHLAAIGFDQTIVATFADWKDTHVFDEVAIKAQVVVVTVVIVTNAALVTLIVLIVDDGWIIDNQACAVPCGER